MAARNYTPYTLSESKKDVVMTFDIGIMIALPEEFNLFMKYLQGSPKILDDVSVPTQFWADDLTFWRFNLRNGQEIIQVVAYLVGEMGTEYTSIATSILVEKWKIPFIVNIGVTGSLDDDLKVGSILVPTQITHYTANWKVKDSHTEGSKNVDFILGTRAFATNRLVLSQFANYVTSTQYNKWKSYCEDGVVLPEQPVALGKKKHSIDHPTLHLGHLASGNMVVDSEHYKSLIKASDRKLMACDMEAAGFAIAEQFLRAPVRVASQFLSLRCISDMAADKAEAEAGVLYVTLPADDTAANKKPEGIRIQNREYAMRNATILFMFLVKDGVINASTKAQLAQLDALTEALKVRSKLTEARVLQPTTQSVQVLIANISTQEQFKKMPAENKLRIIKHFGGDANTNAKSLDSVGISLLQDNNILGKRPSSTKHSSTGTDSGELTNSAKKFRGGASAATTTPLPNPAESSDGASSSESKSDMDLSGLSRLRGQVKLLSELLQEDIVLSSSEVETIAETLQNAINRLQSLAQNQ